METPQRSRKQIAIGLLMLLAAMVVSSSVGWLFVRLSPSNEIWSAIPKELPVGSPAADIEAFCARHHIECGYESAGGVYEGIVRHVWPFDHAVSVTIFVDSQQRFVSATVEDVYDFL